MTKLISILRNAPKRTAAIALMIALAIIVPATLLAWGPSRATFTTAVPATYVTFNSIIDNPAQGDERNFVQIRDAVSSNTTYTDNISLVAGHEYVVFVYFHNNAASNFNGTNFDGTGVAHGAYVKTDIPAVISNGSTSTKLVGYVGAANANPTEVWDDVTLSNTTGGDIALRYVPSSATIHSFGAVNGLTLPDSIATTGTALGYSSLNGVVPGCNDYAGYVTFRVTADQPNFTLSKQVHKTGATGWKETEALNIGDSVDYLITYTNTGTTTQNDVVVSDILPAGITYTDGTTYVANGTNPNGIKVSDNLTKASGINIGNYAIGTNAYIKFSAKVTATSASLNCGLNTLVNTAKADTNNGIKTDTANVTLTKTCTTPPELPLTGAGDSIATILGLGTIVTSVGYYIASRRAIR